MSTIMGGESRKEGRNDPRGHAVSMWEHPTSRKGLTGLNVHDGSAVPGSKMAGRNCVRIFAATFVNN